MPDHRKRWTPLTVRRRRAQRPGRRLQIENLERRLVLSGLTTAAGPTDSTIDACIPPESAPTLSLAVAEGESSAATLAAAQETVYQSGDGVIHVPAVGQDDTVVVRQFIDYRLEHVVEIELAGRWFAFPADSVREVQVQKCDGARDIRVTDGVTKPVRMVPAEPVDGLLGQESIDALVFDNADFVSSSTVDVADSLLSLPASGPVDSGWGADPGPEGEGTVGGTSVPLLPPTIVDFAYSRELDCWEFTGQVLDDKDVTGLTISFGGILGGKTAVVNEDGYFMLVVELPPDVGGFVTAHTVDNDGLGSNTPRIQLI